MDSIIKLLKLEDPVVYVQYNNIWVIVDHLTKWSYFLPFKEATSTKKLTFLFEREIISIIPGQTFT